MLNGFYCCKLSTINKLLIIIIIIIIIIVQNQVGSEMDFLFGCSSKFGRAVKFNKKYF